MKHLTNQTEAFSQGMPVWVIADMAHSGWAKKLDWYLNFQLRKANLHESKQITESDKVRIESWGVELIPNKIPSQAPLLIASYQLLPNQLTLQIPFRDLKSWTESTLKALEGLKVESARVFLPKGIKADEFSKIAQQKIRFEVVEEAALA